MDQIKQEEPRLGKNNFGKIGWAVIIFVFFLEMLSAIVTDSQNVTIGAFSSAYGWDSNLLLSFLGIGGFLGIAIALILGTIVVKVNVKWPTIISMFILAALWLFNGFSNSLVIYAIALILIIALSNAVNLISTQQIMSNYFQRKKGLALGFATMGMCFSSAFLVPLVQVMFSISFQAPFVLMAVVMVVLAFVAIFWFKSYPEEKGAYPDNEPISEEERAKNIAEFAEYKSPYTIGKLLKTGQFWLLIIIFGFLFMGLVGVMIQMIPRLMALGLDMTQSLMWLTIASIIGIPASYLWGLTDQKIGTKKATIVLCLAWTVSMVLAFIGMSTGSVTISVISVIIVGYGIGGLKNLMPSMGIQVFGRYDFASANKLITPIVIGLRTSILMIMSALLAAAGTDAVLGFRNLFILLTILSAIALILSFFLSNKTIGKVKA